MKVKTIILSGVLCVVSCLVGAFSVQEKSGNDTRPIDTSITATTPDPTWQAETEQEYAEQEQETESDEEEPETEQGETEPETEQETESEEQEPSQVTITYPYETYHRCPFCGYDNACTLWVKNADSWDAMKCYICGNLYKYSIHVVKNNGYIVVGREDPEQEADGCPHKTSCTCWLCGGELWAINDCLFRCIDCWADYGAENGEVKYLFS